MQTAQLDTGLRIVLPPLYVYIYTQHIYVFGSSKLIIKS